MNNDVTEWKLRLVTVRELSSAWGRQPMNGGADKPMAGPYIEALDATPFGDTVSDFDRLSATTTEAVVRAVDPAIARIRDLLRPKVMTGRDLVVHMHSITAAAEDALSALDAVIPNEVTVEQLVDQFERDYLLSPCCYVDQPRCDCGQGELVALERTATWLPGRGDIPDRRLPWAGPDRYASRRVRYLCRRDDARPR